MFQRLLNYQPILLAFVLAFSIILGGCEVQSNDKAAQQLNGENIASGALDEARKELTVHFIDVGQGDATLFKGPDFTILIDAGRHDSKDVTPYLQKQGVSDIDLMILTHPHSDHIGQADIILEELNVKEIWMSGDEHSTQVFERILDAILERDVEYLEPRAGESYQVGSALVEVVNPFELTGNLHEGSISVRISYLDIKFLFTGDAEQKTEAEMIGRRHDLQADIFQLGHHGSSTSNTKDFLKKVQPDVAIYSTKENNSYGHPDQEIVTRINNLGIDLYGTDIHGTIIITTDGKQYTVSTTKSGTITTASETEAVETSNDCININTASEEELEKIIHLSTTRIAELIQFRPFSSIDELTQINGISTLRLADIKEQGFICLE